MLVPSQLTASKQEKIARVIWLQTLAQQTSFKSLICDTYRACADSSLPMYLATQKQFTTTTTSQTSAGAIYHLYAFTDCVFTS